MPPAHKRITIDPLESPKTDKRYLSETPASRPSIFPRIRNAPSPQSRIYENVLATISQMKICERPAGMFILDVPYAHPIAKYVPYLAAQVMRISLGMAGATLSEIALDEFTFTTLLL